MPLEVVGFLHGCSGETVIFFCGMVMLLQMMGKLFILSCSPRKIDYLPILSAGKSSVSIDPWEQDDHPCLYNVCYVF